MNLHCTVPPFGPGGTWECPDGHRHFVCYTCGRTCTADPEFTTEDAIAENIAATGADLVKPVSVCDDCYPRVIEQAKLHGLIPQ